MSINVYKLIPLIILLVSSQQALSQSEVYSKVNQSDSFSVIEYQTKIIESLKDKPPVLNQLVLDKVRKQVLDIAFQNTEFLKYTRIQTETGMKVARSEIFNIRPAGSNDLVSQQCHKCWTVELFNFTANLTTIAVVNLDKSTVETVRHIPDLQIESPAHLGKLAIDIAINNKEIERALGGKPKADEFIMAGTKSALNQTRCERSRHFCVAPTFVRGTRALWTIVDLTDLKLVGIRWTEWQDQPIAPISEQKLRDEAIMEKLCSNAQSLEQNNWKIDYSLTSSDGLLISNAKYKNQLAFDSIKNVDWHVSYSDKEGFGYSDAVGCPIFSAAAVVPAEMPELIDIISENKKIGFEIRQEFFSKLWPLPCNYFYQQLNQFFNDGSFRAAVASVGRGCGESGTYRPVIRIKLPFAQSHVFKWTNNNWQEIQEESWLLQDDKSEYSPQGYWLKVTDSTGKGYFVEPGRGQFKDGGKGDNAYLYLTKFHTERDEGELDLPTVGPCCNSDFHQGPEKFIDQPAEKITNQPLVIWYVPQLKNNGKQGEEYCWASSEIIDGKIVYNKFPCIAGPKFIPIKISS